MKFDIIKHQWKGESYPDVKLNLLDEGLEIKLIEDQYHSQSALISKDDAIAIAKHFGLIKEKSSIFLGSWCGADIFVNTDQESELKEMIKWRSGSNKRELVDRCGG